MTDMLVRLYDLPPLEPVLAEQQRQGILVRRAMAAEKHFVVAWVRQTFSEHWASECDVAFSHLPVSCFIAIEQDHLLGFACHDACYKNFFGPTGVAESHRGRGIGAALLLACLHAMKEQGYAYGIIGGVGPVDFYERVVGAVIIENSTPGIYPDML